MSRLSMHAPRSHALRALVPVHAFRRTPVRMLIDKARAAVLCLFALAVHHACAQLRGGVSIVSDYRYRGMSLSRGQAVPQAHVGVDAGNGWYGGAFVSGVKFADERAGRAELLAYAGYAARRNVSATGWDAGVKGVIFPGAPSYNYLEAYAGMTAENLSGRLYVSPDYFGGGIRTLYAEIDGRYPFAQSLRLVGHLGLLRVFSASADYDSYPRDRADLSLGAEFDARDWTLRVIWSAARPDRGAPASAVRRGAHALVLSATVLF